MAARKIQPASITRNKRGSQALWNPRRRDEPKKAKERYLTLRVNGVPLEKTRESLDDDLKSTAIPDPALLKPMSTLSHISLVRLNKHSACATATFHTSFPSDELVRRLQAASNERGYPYKFDSGFYGITPLYEHEKDAYVDLIAVTGLGGHAFGSWKSPTSDEMWLRDYLPKDIPNHRVILYGYNTKLQESQSKQSIEDLGATFMENITSFRDATESSQRPIIFIGHSLGGLVIKEALLRADGSSGNISNLHKACFGMFFFGVPNLGLRYDQLLAIVRDRPNEALIKSLVVDRDSAPSYLKRISDQFSKQFEGHFVQIDANGTLRKTDNKAFLVTQESATTIGVVSAAQEDNIPLHTDHSGLVKYDSMNGQPYTIVSGRLQRIIDKARDVVAERFFEERLYPPTSKSTQDCLQSLAFPKMNDRYNEIHVAHDGTCTWLQNHQSFKDWRSKPRTLLWIKGKLGSGKSTLVKYALEETKTTARKKDFTFSFFFHRRGNELQKTPLGFYRSVLHQLLQKFTGALSGLVGKFTERKESIGSSGEKWSWHLEELRGFLQTSLAKILEASAVVLFTLLKGLPETKFRFGICFSCRHYPITEPDYESRDGLMILVEDKNHADINRYVENSLSRLPSYREDYASLITSRAAGVFLWAVLVVKQVLDLKRNVKNHVTIMKEINKIPQDLDELYHNIIKDLRTPRTTLKLIQWICFVQEPLTANKLRWAIAIDPDGRYKTLRECRNSEDFIDDDDIDTGINVLSCGLAEVIQSGARTVQFIHQSVKDFFTERGLAILAGNSKPAGVVLIEANYMIIRSSEGLAREEQEGIKMRLQQENGYRRNQWEIRGCGTVWSDMAQREKLLIENEVRWGPLPWEKHQEQQKFCDWRWFGDRRWVSWFPLIRYAVISWVPHARVIQGAEDIPANYLLDFFFDQPSNQLFDRWMLLLAAFDPDGWSRTTLLHALSTYGLTDAMPAIINKLRTPLQKALLLEAKADPNFIDNQGETILSTAVQIGYGTIVQLLLEAKADPNCVDWWKQPVLWYAMQKKNEAIVRLSLEAGADPNSIDNSGRTMLWRAVHEGHGTSVQLLPDAKADPDFVDRWRRNRREKRSYLCAAPA
ncbi:hypothetical protein F4824DRAFT_491112 [Ustulina deusta]|nr:hypothetical protein F4824DRAFT_491112 [Ustulina deusta]